MDEKFKIQRSIISLFCVFMIVLTTVFVTPTQVNAASGDLGTMSKKNPSVEKAIDVESGKEYDYSFTTTVEGNYTVQLLNPMSSKTKITPLVVKAKVFCEDDESQSDLELEKDFISVSTSKALPANTKMRIHLSDIQCKGTGKLVLCVYSEPLGGKEADHEGWYNKLNAWITISYCRETLVKGETKKLSIEKSNVKKVKWKSSAPSVVKVSKKGVITAKKYGKATITCYDASKPSVRSTCVVNVKESAKKITLNKTKASTYALEQLRLKAKISPKKAAGQNVLWKSSDPKIATVDENGIVTGIKSGKVTITALVPKTSKKNLTASCVVTLKKARSDPSDISIKDGRPDSRVTTVYRYGGAAADVYYTLKVGNYSGKMKLIFDSGGHSLEKELNVKKNTTYLITTTVGFSGSSDTTIYGPNGLPLYTIPKPMANHKITVTLPDGSTFTHTISAKGSVSAITAPGKDFYKKTGG